MISVQTMLNETIARTHWTLKQIAAASGLHKETVFKYSSGAINNPTLQSMEALAKVCGYRLELKKRDIPQSPCESCKKIKKDCQLSCIPFADYHRSLAKRRTAWKR